MNKFYFSLSLALLFAVASCKKTVVDNETSSSTDYALATQEFLQVFMNINESCLHQKGLSNLYIPGVMVAGKTDSLSGDTTHDSQGTFTNTSDLPALWVRYTNYTGSDGKIRNGTILISFTKQYDVINSVVSFGLINYTVNGAHYMGSFTMTRKINNSFNYNTINGICSNSDHPIKYNCNNTNTLFNNNTVNNFSDDYVQVSGTANGTNSENRDFEATITDPIVKRTDCSWVSQGKVDIKPGGIHTRSLDFGNGNCDDIAAFVVDGQTFTVHMSK